MTNSDKHTSAPAADGATTAADDEYYRETPEERAQRQTVEAALPKMQLWQRKLLDFSLRNTLLNVRVKGRVIPLAGTALAEMEDALQEGTDFELVSEPGVMLAPADESGMRDSAALSEAQRGRVRQMVERGQLPAYVAADALAAMQRTLARNARNSMEENGANTLFLVLGTLCWQETGRAAKPRHAPLLLMPVQLVKRAGNRYALRRSDDEIFLNTTLVEFLREQHDIDLSAPLTPLPADASGVDVAAILRTVAGCVAEKPGWSVREEALLGIFSFNKFVMWNDLHTGAAQMRSNAVVASLVGGKLHPHAASAGEGADAAQADATREPAAFCVPVAADSSQLEAIIEAGEGRSFILHGPPGTGKSQTITNIIANCLYQGKRVLFVAQKMAALTVVQRRLAKIGIGDFCLEVHSNKATKSHFLSQLDTALGVAHQARSEDFDRLSDELFAQRKSLIEYMQALHSPLSCGLSVYDCIAGALAIEGETLEPAPPLLAQLDSKGLEAACRKLEELDAVFRSTGHPADHPLRDLRVEDTSVQAADHLQAALSALKAAAEKRGTWFLTRMLARRALTARLRHIGDGISWDGAERFIAAKCEGTDLSDALTRWTAATSTAHNWSLWCTRRRELEREGLADVVAHLLARRTTAAATAAALRKGTLRRWALQGIDASQKLQQLNGLMLEEMIGRYRLMADRFQTLTRQELYYRLAARIPSVTLDVVNNSEMSLLKRQIKSKGRGKTIRQLFDSIPNLLPRLCPCMLMSPISVAQYLSLDTPPFDLVIFDEASQIPTCEAVGAIARGKALVVVGDPMQMPPTSFFAANSTHDEDADLDDMESILDDCLALSLPSRHLTWHYRSRHESLIAFSNAHYYGRRLLTFPSTDDRETKVSLVHVDGTYDMGRTHCNRAEAEAVVAETLSRLADNSPQRPSIGIVAFSKAQADLIEDLLAAELASHPDLERRAYEGADPVFVKNLENVQGDERDLILFSVGYGPDKDGKVSMNFGPLNNQGGERRLNVAVSRSCREMKVFASLLPEQIDLSRTQAEGVKGLKAFLEYARSGRGTAPAQAADVATPDALVESIAHALRDAGHEVDTHVGRSNFKVDVAVLDPRDPQRYLLGILCDGRALRQAKTERDREIGQPGVLAGLGWHIQCVRAVDWFLDPEQVLRRMEERLKNICEKHEEKEGERGETKPLPYTEGSKTEAVQDTSPEARAGEMRLPLPYTPAVITPVRGTHTLDEMEGSQKRLAAQIGKIIAAEQPITLSLLTRRVAELWGVRQTARLSRLVVANLGSAYCDALQKKEAPYFWTDFETSSHYTQFRTLGDRAADEVPLIEFINAALYGVEQQVAVPLDDLRALAPRIMGFARKSEKVCEAASLAIDILLRTGKLGMAEDNAHTVFLREG